MVYICLYLFSSYFIDIEFNIPDKSRFFFNFRFIQGTFFSINRTCVVFFSPFFSAKYRKTPFFVPLLSRLLKNAKLVGVTISNHVIISKKRGSFHGTNLRNLIFLNFFSVFATLLSTWYHVKNYHFFFIFRLFSFVLA